MLVYMPSRFIAPCRAGAGEPAGDARAVGVCDMMDGGSARVQGSEADVGGRQKQMLSPFGLDARG